MNRGMNRGMNCGMNREMSGEIRQACIQVDRPLSRTRRFRLLALPATAIVVVIAAAMAFAIFQPIRVLPRIKLAPAYSFVDQAGEKFTSESVRGALTLYTFSDSRCTAPCRSTSATLAALQDELGQTQAGALPLNFVTIFVDSGADPAAAKQTADAAVDPVGRYLVTGDSKEVKEVVGAGFGVYYGADQQGRFSVDPVFVLVDGWGIMRAVYRTPAPDIAILKRDLSLVAQEVRNSTGVNRYAYEAAHLFLCYPK